MPVMMTQVQLRRHTRRKDLQCFLLPAAYVLIAGRAVSQAVLVATWQVHWWHTENDICYLGSLETAVLLLHNKELACLFPL